MNSSQQKVPISFLQEWFTKTKRCCAFFICIAMVAPFLLSSCAPVISQRVLQEVDQSLSFKQLLEKPETHKGKTVLLGGNIIETQNFSDRTLIIVLQRPIGFRKKPTDEDVSEGRFIVFVSGFLDPAIYHNGRKITIVGSVVGKEVRPLGGIEYSYPVIKRKELYLWPARESSLTKPMIHFGLAIGTGF